MNFRRLLIFAVVLIALTVTLAQAQPPPAITRTYPFPNVNPFDLFQYQPFMLQQGWENGQLVWFICTDASDQQVACEMKLPISVPLCVFFNGINFAPKLANAAGHVATMYVITNVNQGPVFTAVPGDPTYSGVWQVVYVTFKPGVTPFCVNNAAPFDAVTNPHGLPGPDLATFATTNRAGLPFVEKCPILAVGPLGGPWSPAVPGSYRIPQARVFNDYARTKVIFLPFWDVYCSDPITKAVMIRQIIVPDVWDPTGQLTIKLGANNAPGLAAIPASAEQPLYLQTGVLPTSQLPILHACPTFQALPCRNQNFDYTPVDILTVLQRNPTLPPSAVINNEATLLRFLAAGCLTQVSSNVILNAPVLPNVMATVTGYH